MTSAQFSKAFNIRHKNDVADSQAIWLAVQQLGKPVAIKTETQQAMFALHRTRQQLIVLCTMQINDLRSLLSKFCETMGKGRTVITKSIPEVIAHVAERLPAVLIEIQRDQWDRISQLDEHIIRIEQREREKTDRAVKVIGEIPEIIYRR